MSMDSRHFRDLLRTVSRSFSLTLFALPKDQRAFVGTTYMVARLADTLADSGNWSSDFRLAYFERWENSLFARDPKSWEFEDSVGNLKSAEAELLLNGDALARMYRSSNQDQRAAGDQLLGTLFDGMKRAIRLFDRASSSEPVFGCNTDSEFDWYCYSNAGCVGLFWVKVFKLPIDLEHLATAYGKALERVNILRDLVEDRAQGRIYLSKAALERFGLESTEPWNEPEWKSFLKEYIQETRQMFLFGAQFCDSLPRWNFKLRWASMMPLKIGLKSLKLYESNSVENKVSRAEVKACARESFWDSLLGRKLSERRS